MKQHTSSRMKREWSSLVYHFPTTPATRYRYLVLCAVHFITLCRMRSYPIKFQYVTRWHFQLEFSNGNYIAFILANCSTIHLRRSEAWGSNFQKWSLGTTWAMHPISHMHTWAFGHRIGASSFNNTGTCNQDVCFYIC